jgi:membrane protein
MERMFRRSWVLSKHTYLCYLRHNCSQQAAAIAYYILFSLIPITIVLVSIFGFLLARESLRDDFVDRVLDVVPFSQTEGRDFVERTLNNVKRVSGPIALLGVAGTIWSASAVFSSIRRALNVVWGVEERRPFVRQKLVDFAQLGVMMTFLLASLVLTGVLRAARELSADFAGPFAFGNPLWEIPYVMVPALLTFSIFVAMYHTVPAVRPRWRDALPGAVLATLLFEALKISFAFYVANFSNYDVVFGSLGGAFLLLLYMFLAANTLLIGAEVAYTLQRYHQGDFAEELAPGPPAPWYGARAYRALRALLSR